MAIRYFLQILAFFNSAAKQAKTDVNLAEEENAGDASVHRFIVAFAGLFGLIGGGLGIAVSVAIGSDTIAKEGIRLFLAPPLFVAGGLLLGSAIALLFAPSSFLTGPAGEKWRKLVGTNSVIVVRIVCLIFLLLLAAVIALISWAVLQNM